MEPSAIFVANLPLIEGVAARVCRHWRVYGADAEDFASQVKLMLIENDYAILRKWEGRSSLGGYLTVVIQRMLLDERTRARGRWHASADATRMGRAAAVIREAVASLTLEERMVLRFRFGTAMSAPRIATVLRLSLRTFYRRLDDLIERLRRALRAAGIDAAILDAPLEEVDFGLEPWHDEESRPSMQMTAAGEDGP